MGFMKLRKNKKYNYQPRYYKGDGFEVKHKFDDQRTTINPAKGIKGKFNAALDDYQYNKDDKVNRRVLIIIGILVFLFLLVIGFDLSIFLPNS